MTARRRPPRKIVYRKYPKLTLYASKSLDANLLARARALAAERRQSLSAFLVSVLEEFLERHEYLQKQLDARVRQGQKEEEAPHA